MSTKLVQSAEPYAMRIVAGQITVSGGVPSITAGVGFTVADTAAGQVTVSLDIPGRRLLAAVATAIEATDATAHTVKVDTITNAASVLFNIYVHDATDGALVDNVSFSFIIVLSDKDA